MTPIPDLRHLPDHSASHNGMFSRSRAYLALTLGTLIGARLLWLFWLAWPLTADDALISLRYAQHLAAGQGLVWNVGEQPLEGYSNFFNVLLAASAIRLTLDPVIVLKAAGILGAMATCVFSYKLARLWTSSVMALVPVSVIVAIHGTSLWGVSGMETMTYVAAVLCVMWLAFTGRPAAAGVALLFAGLVRPEAPLVAVAVAVGYALERDWRSLATFMAAAAVPYTMYFGWRLWEFGRLFPNPVYCKFRAGGEPWRVVSQLMTLAIPALGVLIGSKLDRRHLTALILVILYAAILYGVDPVVTAHHRLDLPAGALLITVAAATALARLPPQAKVIAASSVFLITFAVPTETFVEARTAYYARRNAVRGELAAYLARRVTAHDAILLGDVGQVGALVPARIYDALCLNSAEMTRSPINRDPAKYADWAMGQRPKVLVLTSLSVDSLSGSALGGLLKPLTEHPAFQAYRHDTTIGLSPTNPHYWVFSRGEAP